MAAYVEADESGVATGLHIASFSGGQWNTSIVELLENRRILSIAMALDPGGSAAIVASARAQLSNDSAIRYYSRQLIVPSFQWIGDDVALLDNPITQSRPFPVELAFSTATGAPMVAYFRSEGAISPSFELARKSGGTWIEVTPPGTENIWATGTLLAKPDGEFSLLATENDPSAALRSPVLFHYDPTADTWSFTPVQMPGSGPGIRQHLGVAMTLNDGGEIRTVFGSKATGSSVFSEPRYWEEGNLDAGNIAITERPIEENRGFGQFHFYDIKTLNNGNMAIAALDENEATLWFAVRQENGVWWTEKVVEGGVLAAPIRLFTTSTGMPAIGYLTETEGRTDLQWARALAPRP